MTEPTLPTFGGHTAAELRALHKRATSDPWSTVRPSRDTDGWATGVIVAATAPRQCIYANPPGGTFPAADQKLIAAARNALPDLLTALDAADARITGLEAMLADAQAEVERLREALNTPEIDDFARGVVLEAQHQRARWGSTHDVGKENTDWFWLVGYLAGKALAAAGSGNREKALHHTISTAAALANWHAALSGKNHDMRPGIDPAALAGAST